MLRTLFCSLELNKRRFRDLVLLPGLERFQLSGLYPVVDLSKVDLVSYIRSIFSLPPLLVLAKRVSLCYFMFVGITLLVSLRSSVFSVSHVHTLTRITQIVNDNFVNKFLKECVCRVL